MREIILVKYGEMALKGLNRGSFEDVLLRNIRFCSMMRPISILIPRWDA